MAFLREALALCLPTVLAALFFTLPPLSVLSTLPESHAPQAQHYSAHRPLPQTALQAPIAPKGGQAVSCPRLLWPFLQKIELDLCVRCFFLSLGTEKVWG